MCDTNDHLLSPSYILQLDPMTMAMTLAGAIVEN
jgi:hypothetical protein